MNLHLTASAFKLLQSQIDSTSQIDQIDRIVKQGWSLAAAGRLGLDEAEAIQNHAQIVRDARKAFLNRSTPSTRNTPLARHYRSKQTPYSQRVLKVRTLSQIGILPAPIACHFTPHRLAVVAVMLLELMKNPKLTLTIDAIAARCSVSPGTVRNAIRDASALDLIRSTERRSSKTFNLPNLIVLGSNPQLVDWLSKRSRWVKASEIASLLSVRSPVEPDKPTSGFNPRNTHLKNRGFFGLKEGSADEKELEPPF